MRLLTGSMLSTMYALVSLANHAYADELFEYKANHAITSPIVSTPAIVSAMLMGAKGFKNYDPPTDWRTSLLTSCVNETTRITWNGVTQDENKSWPDKCDPKGIVSSINTLTLQEWSYQTYVDGKYGDALALILTSVEVLGTPVVLPIYGQADHWVVFFDLKGVKKSSGKRIIQSIGFEDGLELPKDYHDNKPLYDAFGGTNIMSGGTLPGTYYSLLDYINPGCDMLGCSDDYFYNKYVVLFDPPSGARSALNAAIAKITSIELASAPPVIDKAAGPMSAELAKANVRKALELADLMDNRAVSRVMTTGTASDAVLVNAVWPSRQPWNYYLVTMKGPQGSVLGYVQLSAENGAFERIFMPRSDLVDISTSPDKAISVASNAVKPGEHLGTPQLRWDPKVAHAAVRSPHAPFYEIPVVGKLGAPTGEAIRVSYLAGMFMGRVSAR